MIDKSKPKRIEQHAHYLAILRNLRDQAYRQGRPAIVKALSALIEGKTGGGNNRHRRGI